MPRRVEDIIRNDRRSIRDVAPEKEAVSSKRGSSKAQVSKPEKVHEVPIHKLKITAPIHVSDSGKSFAEPKKRKATKERNWWPVIVLVVVLLVAASGYFASIYFSRATFTIVPMTMPVSVDTTIVATASSTPGYVSYKTSLFVGGAKTEVPAITGATVSTKSSGYITISNSYSKDSQRLTAGTRLSSDNNLIYKLTGSVSVPGYTVSTKGVIIPGTLNVSVVADQAGAEYNLTKALNTASVFKIIAYQGGPRYSAFSGRLATDLTGGFSGQKKTVDKTLLASTTANLQTALAAELLAKAKASVPDGFIMYDSAYKTLFSAPVLSGTTTNSATITVNGSLYAVLFSTSDLTAKLAGSDKVNSFNAFPYRTPGLESLSFTITNQNDFSPAKQNTLIAHIKGDLKLVGIIPVESLKTKLAGLSLTQTSSILKAYSSIVDVSKSSGELFPSWSMSVPSDRSRITINVKDN